VSALLRGYGTHVSSGQHPVEIIMARGFVSNITTPAFLVDSDGTLVFYNEAAGDLLGVGFEESGPLPARDWASRFEPVGRDGRRLPFEQLPLVIALTEARAAHREMQIKSATGEPRDIAVTAFPVVGQDGQSGAIAIFWGDR
jgi:PAS domain-containing protein